MKKTVSLGIGFAFALTAAPFLALAHDTGEPHPHPQATGAMLPKPVRQDIKDEVEQKRLRASTTGERPDRPMLMKKEMEMRHMAGSSTRPMSEEMLARRAELKSSLEERHAKFEGEGKKRLDGLKKKFGEEKSARIEEHFKKMVEKFEAAIERQQKYADKISEFLDKAETNGKDVAALRTKLASASEAVLAAESALEDAKAKYAEAAANTDFTARFAAVKALIEGVAGKIKASHQALTEIIATIKGLGGRGEHRASTTPES